MWEKLLFEVALFAVKKLAQMVTNRVSEFEVARLEKCKKERGLK